MARKPEKTLSVLKRALIKSCLGGVPPGKAKRREDDDDEPGGGERRVKPAEPKGYADSVMGKRG